MKDNLLDLFYNYVVKEATIGRIDCFLKYNLIFNTRLVEDDLEFMSDNKNDNLIIPTLLIKNRKEFESLLLEYVDKALKFYDDTNFYEEVRECDFRENEMGISKEKLIMTLLWSNATIEDFNNPCSYLRKRIAFFDLGCFEKYQESQLISYSEILNSDIEVMILKNRIEHETPYSMKLNLKKADKIIYEFPRIYFGIKDDNAYIYAIQNSKGRYVDEDNVKKIERKMYTVNEGLDVHDDIYDNYGVGNLKDITPSFLIAANIFVGLLRENGITKVNISSILISRWNAKMITMEQNEMRAKIYGIITDELKDKLDKYYNESIRVQSNLTEKFLRIFRRLGYHHSSISILNQPMELESNLVLELFKGKDVCNNQLLDETYGSINEKLHMK